MALKSSNDTTNHPIRRHARATLTLRDGKEWRVSKAWGDTPNRYKTFARFKADNDRAGLWTLLIQLTAPLDREAKHLEAVVYYFAPEAPQDLILPDAEFLLYPGYEKDAFADGIVRQIVPE